MASSVDISPAWCIQENADHSARLFRRMLYGLTREGIANFVAGTGTFTMPGDLKVTQQATPGMGITVAIGGIYVLGDTLAPSGAQGQYFGYNDTARDLDVAAADATNARKDIVVAEFLDNNEDAGLVNKLRLRVITGTPAGSPAEPATPGSAYRLATIDVAAGATSITNANITDRRARVEAMGVSRTQRRTGVKMTRSTNQSINNNTDTLVTWDTEAYDDPDNPLHSTSANTSRITIPTGYDGLWRFEARIAWAGQTTETFREITLLKNGAMIFRERTRYPTTSADYFMKLIHEEASVGGDYWEVQVHHDHGSAINVLATSSAFLGRRVSE